MKLLYFSIALVGLLIQQGYSQTNSWGENVCGTELSINLTNNDILVGRAVTLHCRVKNLSTNDIYFIETDPKYDFQVSLISNSGEVRKLSPDPSDQSIFMRVPHKLNLGEIYECNIPIQLDKKIGRGNYKFEVALNIFYQSKKYQLVSNSLEVQIK
jgi:hypothetical protein